MVPTPLQQFAKAGLHAKSIRSYYDAGTDKVQFGLILNSNTNSDELSTAAIVGIAVGAAVVGALAVVATVCMKMQKPAGKPPPADVAVNVAQE